MKKGIISKSLLLSFIGVLLCISMFVGTTLALFSLTVTSGTNTVISSAFDVTVKIGSVFDADSFTTDLDGTTLFDNTILLPGQRSEIQYIRINNKSGGKVSVSAKIVPTENGNTSWKYYHGYSTSFENSISFTSSDFDFADPMVLYSGKIDNNGDVIIGLAIELPSDYETKNDAVSFAITVEISQDS